MIRNASDLLGRLQHIATMAREPNPSRVILAGALYGLADELTAPPIKTARVFRSYFTLEQRVKILADDVNKVMNTVKHTLHSFIGELGSHQADNGTKGLLGEFYNSLEKIKTLLVEDVADASKTAGVHVRSSVPVGNLIKGALHGIYVTKGQIERDLEMPLKAMVTERDIPADAQFALKQVFHEVQQAISLLSTMEGALEHHG